ncbi:MAG: hypothetical protein JWO80_5960 [Bryobacterales bacterium]|nr:hypothetical protein [Bryobacterales bacterium]
METIVPALAYGGGCSSAIELRNLGQGPVVVDAEPHREDGALASLVARSGVAVHLRAGETASVQAQIEEETNGVWVRVRETVQAGYRPVVTVRGTTECVEGANVRTVHRDVSYATRNPWWAGDVDDLGDGSILLINTSERPARASLCYSSGSEFSLPGRQFDPICSASAEVHVPPFGSRTFAVRHGANNHFAVRTSGDRIVLQMLRSVAGTTRMFTVDSAISFGNGESREP